MQECNMSRHTTHTPLPRVSPFPNPSNLDCKERSGQLRRRSLGCLSNDGATTIISIISNISRYFDDN
ncbi:hypothetical protein DVH24_042085 [Malus domestica]|uniref:Uncharacterized protein n=1 Tax=Malus domestica TaxID=3750 RepID=A0A498IT79_MALDO|nr:hypothetical protein DVH24_042085 [Malus domestica]